MYLDGDELAYDFDNQQFMQNVQLPDIQHHHLDLYHTIDKELYQEVGWGDPSDPIPVSSVIADQEIVTDSAFTTHTIPLYE